MPSLTYVTLKYPIDSLKHSSNNLLISQGSPTPVRLVIVGSLVPSWFACLLCNPTEKSFC